MWRSSSRRMLLPPRLRSSQRAARRAGDGGDAERPPEALLEAVLAHPSSQKPGPTGTVKSLWAVEVALRVDGQRQLRQRPAGGAGDRLRAVQQVERRLVARAHEDLGLVLVLRHRAAGVRADARVRHVALRAPGLAPGQRLEARVAADAQEGDLRVGRVGVALGERDEERPGGQGVAGHGDAVEGDEAAAGAPGRRPQAVLGPRPERAEQHDLAEHEHAAGEHQQLGQEAAGA